MNTEGGRAKGKERKERERDRERERERQRETERERESIATVYLIMYIAGGEIIGKLYKSGWVFRII